MLISEIAVTGTRLSASVTWEQNLRPQQTLWFDTPQAVPPASAAPFLVGCALPAMRDGEKRVAIEGAVDLELLENVTKALTYVNTACGYENPPPALEVGSIGAPPQLGAPLAGFLSCGVDSLGMLRANHLWYPETHPRHIRAGIAIKGFDCVNQAQYAQLLKHAHAVGAAAGLEVLEADTNIAEVAQWPHPTRPFGVFSPMEYHGCILAAVAHAFAGRIAGASIASSGWKPEYAFQKTFGSHPLLDPLYGCASLRIYHEDGTVRRLEKLRLVAEWPAGLENLLVCSRWERGEQNCGRCEKCIRTKVEFLALGKLEASPFRGAAATPEEIRSLRLDGPIGESSWEELVEPLAAAGRSDLSAAARAIVEAYQRRKQLAAVKSFAKDFDRRYLGGLAVRANRFARRASLHS